MLSPNNKTQIGKNRNLYAIKHAIKFYLAYLMKTKRSAELGFTLIESLIAAAVVAILIVSISPMVALSTTARVNARRLDQATQAARSYIDAVRGGVIDVSQFPNNLVINNAVASSNNAQGQYTFEAIAAPTATTFPISTICTNPNATTDNVPSGKVPGICVDSNGDGFRISDPQDLFIQPMRSGPLRTVGTVSTDLTNQGFWLAVRVYRASALSGTTLLTETSSDCIAKPAFANASPVTCPIVTMRSQIYLNRTTPVNLDNIKTGIGSP